jgi:hypothetical protein
MAMSACDSFTDLGQARRAFLFIRVARGSWGAWSTTRGSGPYNVLVLRHCGWRNRVRLGFTTYRLTLAKPS